MQGYAVAALGGPRWQALSTTMRFVGADLTGADFRLQARLLPNTPGGPLIDLATVTTAAAEGVRVIGVETINGQKVSTIGIRINETTMEGLPFTGELGDSSVFAWDMQVTPAGGLKQKWIGGDFIVESGVTGADDAQVAPTGYGRAAPQSAARAGGGTFQIGPTIISVTLAGGEGPPGKASGPLGAGSVGGQEISNNAGEQAAITDKLAYLAPLTGAATRTVKAKLAETVSILDLGGRDDWTGSAGTDNRAAFDRAYALAPVTIRLPRSRNGTGVYMVAGSTGLADATGVTLDPDPGVSVFARGSGSPATFLKGQRATRDLRTRYADLRYEQTLGPTMRRRVTELGRPGSALDGELQVPIALDLMDSAGHRLSNWPNGSFDPANPTSTSANAVSWGVPPNPGFVASTFHVLSGDLIQARVSDLATYLPAVVVLTDSGYVIVRQEKGGDLSQLTVSEKLGSAATVETATVNPVVAQTTYRLVKSLVGIRIFGQRSFGLVVNGALVRRFRTSGRIQRAGWAGGFGTGAGSFAIADALLFKSKRTGGIKPLRVIGIGDSTNDETVVGQAPFDFCRQFVAGLGGAQIELLTNLAQSGHTSAQQRAKLQATTIAGQGYDLALIAVGINDIQTGAAPATFVANVMAMVAQCRGAGIEPIVAPPAMFYSAADAQAFGQDGGATSHSADGAEYRLALMRALGDAGVFCNASPHEDMGAVVASLLAIRDAGWGDQVVADNVHPTAWGALLQGWGWAKAIAAYLTHAREPETDGTPLPAAYFTGGVGVSATPRYTLDGSTMHLSYYLSRDGVALADGAEVGTLPKRLRPREDVFAPLFNATDGAGTAASPTLGSWRISPDGKMRVYGVTGSPAFLGITTSWKV